MLRLIVTESCIDPEEDFAAFGMQTWHFLSKMLLTIMTEGVALIPVDISTFRMWTRYFWYFPKVFCGIMVVPRPGIREVFAAPRIRARVPRLLMLLGYMRVDTLLCGEFH